MPTHDVSPVQGKFLALLVKLSNAKRVFEIGTLGGYSTIWMARAPPAGGLFTFIEVDSARAGCHKKLWVRLRRFIDMLSSDKRLDSTALQTVGEKGWDGFTISIVQDQA